MDKSQLKIIESLTNYNNHTEARIFISSNFAYLDRFKKMFQAIALLHNAEGSLDYNLGEYRNKLTCQMLEKIKITNGEKEKNEIEKCL